MRLKTLSAVFISMFAISGHSMADAKPVHEVIKVHGQINSRTELTEHSLVTPSYAVPSSDIADLLKSIPGANVNANGPVSQIAQYRGLYGGRIATKVDGLALAGAGPNSMDAPLSYASILMTESIEMTRGIAPVSSGVDTLGGSLKVNTVEAETGQNFSHILGQFTDNGRQTQLGALTNIAGDSQAVLFHIEQAKGSDEIEDGWGRKIVPSTYDKQQFGVKYLNLFSDNHSVSIGYQGVRTGNSASAALPMDIDFIDSDRIKLMGNSSFNWGAMNWHIGWQNGRHGMSNALLRPVKSPMMARYNRADSIGLDASLSFDLDNWLFGVDFQRNIHDSVITNPNNKMMVVDNFNHVKNQTISAYGQWSEQYQSQSIQIGVRAKQYQFDADKVTHSMAMMNPNLKYLMQRFNQQDRSSNQFGIDLVTEWVIEQSRDMNWRISLARKQSSPSYQQRYLWLPMQATAGLADGRTYLGNTELKLETAYQAELGFDFSNSQLMISPRVFWQTINDYVQGIPLTDMKAKMVAKMMGDTSPLVFANTDARLYGMDVEANYQLMANWQLSMLASYTRGKRTDIEDNLYRLAPLSGQIALNWQQQQWRGQLTWRVASKQDKVSAIQKEQQTAGYGTLDMLAAYEIDNWLVKAGISNLFDKAYHNHLSGYNRAMKQDIAVGERLPGYGRQIWLSVLLSF
ncbi:MAG: TonB-dependent receptor [Parashewanella sp.]